MGVHEGRGALHKAMKQLDARWNEAKMNWDDSRSREFEQRIIVPLHTDMRDAIGAMDQIAVLLAKIRQECE